MYCDACGNLLYRDGAGFACRACGHVQKEAKP
jgi:DNA-directed RNA polymerase subunit M/transcription elongation factor TFIIS